MTAGSDTESGPPPSGHSPVVNKVAVGMVLAGKYRVDKILGEGGMGVVAAATHLQLDEPVAVKFLHAHLGKQTDLVMRFQREAKAARKIRSEHVVRILDVGELDNGSPYMVMEYLAGTDLDALVRNYGPRNISDAIDFVLQACEALAEAHVQGMVHRDLKPANLFISKRADETPLVKVLDFGISKVTGEGGAELGMTKTNAQVLGSPLYMAPEQMRSMRDVDARTDIWALGVILQELMTGVPPFTATTLPELCATILQDPPKPLRTSLPHAPPALEATIARCLQKEPAHRYPDVAALAMDLYPFASAGGRASAERIFGVYRAAGVPRASAPPSSLESARTVSHDPTGPSMPYAVVTPRPSGPPLVGHGTTGKVVWAQSDSIPAPVQTTKSNQALVMALVAIVAVLGTVVVIFVVLPRLKPAPVTPASVAHEGIFSATPTSVALAAPPPAVAPSAAPSTSTTASLPTPLTRPIAAKPTTPPAPAHTPSAAAKPGHDCTVPYIYDSKGKHWKPECVE